MGWLPLVKSGIVFTTWDPTAPGAGIALSGGNLIATYTGSSAPNAVKSSTSHSTGKFYFELTWNTPSSSNTRESGFGNATAGAASLTGVQVGNTGTTTIGWGGGSDVFVNGASITNVSSWGTPGTIALAIDISGALVWFKDVVSGNWNASGAANPATGVGGVSLTITGAPFFVMVSMFVSGDSVTANFGATSYVYTPPAGFSNW